MYSMAGCLPSLYDAQGSNPHFQKIKKKIITEPNWIDGDVSFASDWLGRPCLSLFPVVIGGRCGDPLRRL